METFSPVTLNVLLIVMRLEHLIYFAKEKYLYKRFSNILHLCIIEL